MSNNNEITKRLWKAADQLRANSGLKYSQFARPILGLIFLRYADFKFTIAQKELEMVSQAKPEKGTLEDYIPRRKKKSPSDYQAKGVIFLSDNAQYSYILNLPESENIGKALNDAMKAIESQNDDLTGVLDIEYNEIDDSILIALLKLFSQIDFKYNDDIFGKIYEYFLGKYAMGEGQRGGEFFTPESLVKLIVEVIEPMHGRILDPACGSGGMFVQSTYFVKRYGGIPINEISVFGQEKTLETVKLCKMNLAVHGISGDIKQGNSYYEDLFESLNKFDFVMANPPFNVNGVNKEKIKNDKRFSYGIPNADNANYLWIQIFLNTLNEGGRAGFVMAHSVADVAGSEKDIREKIVEDGFVDVIVSITSNFFHNVTLPCMLWFFDKGKTNTDEVLFIYADNVYNQIDRAHRDFLPEQIEFISNIVRMYRGNKIKKDFQTNKLMKANFPDGKYKDIKGLCKLASIEEIRSTKYSLNPGRYVGYTKEKIKKLDILNEITELNEDLLALNSEAQKLEEEINRNILKILSDNDE